MTIEDWLDAFKSSWKSHDIESVLALFDDSVEYWETPHQLVRGKSSLRTEWSAILSQNDIALETHIFSSHEEKHAVAWNLTYTDGNEKQQHWAGTYLIELDKQGKCLYFHHTGEKNVK